MPDALGCYFNHLSDIIQSESKLHHDSWHKGDKGTHREVICHSFLEKHIPARLTPYIGGQIFGLPDKLSKQLDIIIGHDSTLLFLKNNKPHFPVEAAAAVFSIKSDLSKNALFESLDEFESIPEIDERVLTITGPPFTDLEKNKNEYLFAYPMKVIFAFDGMGVETCKQHITDWCAEPGRNANRLPTAIIVNGKYMISFDRREDQKMHMCIGLNSKDGELRGQPLLWVVATLSKIVPWLSVLNFNYQPYLTQAYSDYDR